MEEDPGATARLLNTLRGGGWGVAEDRDRAALIIAAWPKAPAALRRHDLFRAAAAVDAVTRGVTAVVLAETGFPFGEHPHLAAARASAAATFIYSDSDRVAAGQRRLSLKGDARATALSASIRAPRDLLRAAGLLGDDDQWLGDGPLQLQWGLGALGMGRAEAAALAAEYAALLPSGSELVIAVPDGDEGQQFARLAGLRAHTARSLERWILGAGLKLDGPVDVRAYGRQALGMGLRAHGGRIMAAVGTVP